MTAVEGAERSGLATHLRLYRRRAFMTGTIPPVVILALLFVLYVIVQPSILSTSHIVTLVTGSAAIAIAAAGEAVVVIGGGFDMSVGAAISLINVIIVTQVGGLIGSQGGTASIGSQLGVVLLALLVGAGIGLVNGALVVLLRIPSIVATLAMSFLWSGVALLVLAQPGGSMPREFVRWFTGRIGVIPCTLLVLLFVVGVWLVVKRMAIGRWLYAVGDDVAAARSQGVRTGLVSMFGYTLGGILYGIAAVVMTAISSSGDPNLGDSLLIVVFASVVIGGVAFGGGVGDVVGAVIGAYIIYLINNVLYSMGVSSFYTNILNGTVLIIAVVIGALSGRLRIGRRSPAVGSPDQAGGS